MTSRLRTLGSTAHRLWGPEERALATVCAILFLTFLDNTIVAVALGSIQAGIHTGVAAMQWIVDGYALTFAALMLLGGTLGDLFGRKRVMLGGVAVFCAASVLAALAPTAGVLVGARVLMGVGAAASEPGTLSVIRHLYTDARPRARALGVWAGVSALALALGPVVGGVLIGLFTWRAIFWFNLVFGLAVFAAAMRTVPETADPAGRRLDLPGAAIGVVAITAGTYGIIAGENAGYTTWWVIGLFVVTVLAVWAFVVVEHRVPDPVLRPELFRVRMFTGASVVAFTTFFAIFAIFFFVALYLEVIGTASGFGAALDFLPMAVVMIAASIITGRWVARSGPRLPMFVGTAVGAAGVFLTAAFLGPNAGIATLGWTLAVAGAGFGIAIVPATSAALAVVRPERSGMAASVINTSRELGAVVGVAVLGAIANAQLTGDLLHRLKQLGIPANFQQLVIDAVTHGSVPRSDTAASKTFGSIVAKVLQAADHAFYSGVHISLILSGAMLAAASLLAFFTIHGRRAYRALPSELSLVAEDGPAGTGHTPDGTGHQAGASGGARQRVWRGGRARRRRRVGEEAERHRSAPGGLPRRR